MRIVFTRHAKSRLRERGIRKQDVVHTILKPEWYIPTFNDRIRVQKSMGKRRIEVIYTEEIPNIIYVITCYYL